MTGPEHYRDAEEDLERACRMDSEGRIEDAAFWHREAQVHATLALAAATVRLRTPTAGNWDEVLR